MKSTKKNNKEFENNRINSGIPMIYEPEYSIDNMPNDKELFRFSNKLNEIRNNNTKYLLRK